MSAMTACSFLVLRKVNGNLKIAPTQAGIQAARALLAVRGDGTYQGSRAPDDQLHDMLEEFLGNGWMQVLPEQVGALTDAYIMSDDFTVADDDSLKSIAPEPRVYAHMNYAVEDPVETWANGGTVTFIGDVVERKS